jgi:hypothetical protein
VIEHQQRLALHSQQALAQRAVLAKGGGLAGPANPAAIDHGPVLFSVAVARTNVLL